MLANPWADLPGQVVVVIRLVIVVVSTVTITGVVVSTSLNVLTIVELTKIGGGTNFVIEVIEGAGAVPMETEIGGGTKISVEVTGGAGAVPEWTEIGGGTKIPVVDTGVGQPCLHEVMTTVDVVR